MVLIEMHMSNPSGRTAYIWMSGQAWPVPFEEDLYVMRIEMFGSEFYELEGVLPIGRMSENVPLMDWLPAEAPKVSVLIRKYLAHPSNWTR